ncbi:MAG: hypothetical protein JO249_04390 [Acidobacteria bacterium]|nr:hypothetical protein [Acidobacteriota bacterium]
MIRASWTRPKLTSLKTPIAILLMTPDGSRSACGNPTLAGKIGPWLLIIPSALAGILLVELFCGSFFPIDGQPARP